MGQFPSLGQTTRGYHSLRRHFRRTDPALPPTRSKDTQQWQHWTVQRMVRREVFRVQDKSEGIANQMNLGSVSGFVQLTVVQLYLIELRLLGFAVIVSTPFHKSISCFAASTRLRDSTVWLKMLHFHPNSPPFWRGKS